MKSIIFICTVILLGFQTAWCQAPQGFRYQAVARNANGDVIKNQTISLRLFIRESSPSGATVYSESHSVFSGELGIFSLTVGKGNPILSSFNSIDWSNSNYWLEVEMDASGGTNYQSLGASQIMSVPYALHAATVADKDDADADPTNELQQLSFNPNNNELTLSKGNSVTIPTGGTDADPDPMNEIQSLSKLGSTVSLSRNGGSFIDEVDDADADPNNEIQQLNLAGMTLSITNGNSIDLSPFKSFWKKEVFGISYLDGYVYSNFNKVDSSLDVGNNQPSRVAIRPGNVTVENISQLGGYMNIDPTTLQIYNDDLIVRHAKLHVDSLEFVNQGFQLLPNSRSVFDPYHIQFDFLGARSNLSAGHLKNSLGNFNAQLDHSSLTVREELSPSDVFDRLSIQPDSIKMYTDTKWENVRLGTQAETKNGELKLFSGSNDKVIAHLGNGVGSGQPPVGSLLLYGSDKDFPKAVLSASENSGEISLWGRDDYISAKDGVIGMGAYTGYILINDDTAHVVSPSVILGNNEHQTAGMLKVYSTNSKMEKAGIGVEFDGGLVYSDRAIRIKYPETNHYASCMDEYSIRIVDSLGRDVAGMFRDLFHTNVGSMVTYGGDEFPNVFVGANYNDPSLSKGSVLVAAELGDYRAGVEINADGMAEHFASDGYFRVYDKDYTLISQYDDYLLSFWNPQDAGHLICGIGRLGGTTNTGALLLNGNNKSVNVYAGNNFLSADPNAVNRGMVAVSDNNNTRRAGMFVNDFNQGVLFADIKNFCIDHPNQPDQQIWYASLEGPEAAAYVRGTAQLKNGSCFVEFPEHFRAIANTEGMTVSLSPMSADTYGLAVIEKTERGIMVKELMNRAGNFKFDWEVKTVRKGYEKFEVVRKKQNDMSQVLEDMKKSSPSESSFKKIIPAASMIQNRIK